MNDGTISHYEILEPLGRGGMGVVYLARDLKLGRSVALKFLPADLGENEHARKRFLREAQAASALDNPRICTIYEIGEAEDGRPFISMAHCDGVTLKDRIAEGPLPVNEARAITIQIAEGLAAAHEAGIVHRDIKPANIMLTSSGVRILDFGLAKLSDSTHLTRTGAAMGTPAYMSPEQATGGEVDLRTDLWSLAAILYEMVTGTRPFDGDNATAIMYAILTNDPQPVVELRPEVPDDLMRVVQRGLQRDQTERYGSARELLTDLGVELSRYGQTSSVSFSAGRTAIADRTGFTIELERRSRPRRGPWIAGFVGLLLTAAVFGWWGLSREHGGENTAADVVVVADRPLHVVGVLPFANRTGASDLDWVGGGLARLVTDGLAGSRLLQVVGADRMAAVDAENLAAAAADLGLTAVVSGEMLPGHDGIHGLGAGGRPRDRQEPRRPPGRRPRWREPAALRRRSRGRGAPRPRSAARRTGGCPHRGFCRRQPRGL